MTECTSETPADTIARLQAEKKELEERLATAKERIYELEAGEDSDASVDADETRKAVEALLNQPSLEDVPLLARGSYEEQMSQFEENYGRWLKYFGAEYDRISLPGIRAHDPEGITRLTNVIGTRRSRERKKHGSPQTQTLGDIVPTESDVGNLALAGKTVEDVFADRYLAMLFYGRIRRHLFGS